MHDPDAAAALNRASYDAVAAQWDGARVAFVRREREYLDALLAGLAPGATVLDLGCGTGRPMAAHVLACGHRIVGVDQSRELLALARRRFPGATWIESRIEDYLPQQRFAAAMSWDALFHVAREHHERVLRCLVEALEPGGRLMLTAGGSAHHPAFTDEMFGARFFYDSHAPEQTRALLRGLGLRLVIDEFMDRPDGARNKGRIAIVAEKQE
jgi:cyclopropane fatty-acyl-phospholipid synthase-like methyltransferase